MTILRDLSIYWAMFHVVFIFILLFRSRLNRKSRKRNGYFDGSEWGGIDNIGH